MEVSSIAFNEFTESIQKVNDLMANLASVKMNSETKMLKADIIGKIIGLGENVDKRV